MVERRSEYELTTVFSLNNFYGEAIAGEHFNTPFIGVVPILSEFELTGVDPSGSRHLTNHPSFKQTLASGRNQVSMSFGPLDFGITNISTGSGISKTRCFIFRVNDFDCSTSRVLNMKMWAPDTTDFLTPQNFRIVFETRQAWPSGEVLPVTHLTDKTTHLPLLLPDSQNLFRQDGAETIHGSGDADVSQYVLMAVVASGTLPLGEYVGDPEGFVIRVTYNLDNVFPLQD
jgi:hypothetical protein